MSKIKLIGKAAVMVADFTLEDLKLVEKYRPEALTLKEKKDGKEGGVIFRVASGTKDSVNDFSIVFAGAEMNEDKKACATIIYEYNGKDDELKDYIADKFGGAVIKLQEIEKELPGVIEEIKASRNKVVESITLA